MSFFTELRRRNVFRMGIAYLATVWVLIEVADTLVPIIGAPPWILQALVFSGALGFPLALVLAWVYEWTREGIKATSELEGSEPVGFLGRKLDFAIIGLLVLAVGFLVVDNYILESQPEHASSDTEMDSNEEAGVGNRSPAEERSGYASSEFSMACIRPSFVSAAATRIWPASRATHMSPRSTR